MMMEFSWFDVQSVIHTETSDCNISNVLYPYNQQTGKRTSILFEDM